MSSRLQRCAVLAALIGVALATPSLARRKARLIDLGTVSGVAHSTAWTINPKGQVAGYAYNIDSEVGETGQRAFLWKRGVITTLPGLGGQSSAAYALTNDGRTVVGYADRLDGGGAAAN